MNKRSGKWREWEGGEDREVGVGMRRATEMGCVCVCVCYFVLQVGFGKGTASKQVWIDGIDPAMSESQLERHLSKYGRVSGVRLPLEARKCVVTTPNLLAE